MPEETIVKSVSSFIEEILKKSSKLEKGERLWYRGHSNANFNLMPSLYRKTLSIQQGRPPNVLFPDRINLLERGIDLSFSREAVTFFAKSGIENSQMNRYFLKQHYKVSTRLLDWTESALVALYFAVFEPSEHKLAGEVWLLNPVELNAQTIKELARDESNDRYYLFFSENHFDERADLFNDIGQLRINQLLRKYTLLDVEEDESMFPIAILPPYLDDRMRAQKSCFTLFGNMFDGLTTLNSKHKILSSIKIPAPAKEKILEELTILGFNNFSVYPDLDGLGASVNQEYINRYNQESLAEDSALLFNGLTEHRIE